MSTPEPRDQQRSVGYPADDTTRSPVMAIENTNQRDAFTHLIGMGLGSGRDTSSGYIEGMEAAGQQHLVNSDRLPARGPWADLEALGFVKGKQVDGDDLFVHCELPAGWKRAGTSHSMHSDILDERGVPRVGIFYKAAFYDRRADMHLKNVGYSASTEAIYGDGEPALPPLWSCFTAAEREVFWEAIERHANEGRADQYTVRACALLKLREHDGQRAYAQVQRSEFYGQPDGGVEPGGAP